MKIPGSRFIVAVLPGALLVLLVALIARSPWRPALGIGSRTVDEKATLSVLRSEALTFLVTRRTVTQIVVTHDEWSLWGQWRGVLWATVDWNWGVDLSKITESDLRREGDVIVCRLPEPELLSFGFDPASVGFMSKSTAVEKLRDIVAGGSQRQLLETSLQKHAMAFARERKLCPSRQEIVRQLDEAAEVLQKAAGFKLRFE